MPTLLQVNSVANTGSTGHIAEDIGKLALAHGWESYIAYGRKALTSESRLIRIGNKLDVLWPVFVTRMFDLHGLASRIATKKFVRQIERIKPDVIHLHNIHGYYLNYKILFKYLAKSGVPVVWTLHDCWALTGHCSHYTFAKCEQWETSDACKKCPQKKSYPSCKLFSHSAYNFKWSDGNSFEGKNFSLSTSYVFGNFKIFFKYKLFEKNI
jgi:glycosyltransferase involved in cell wall biosynthesis